MKKITLVLSTLVLVSMLLVACGGEETSTAVPNTQAPELTEAPTLETTEAPEGTATTDAAGTGTGTPGAGAGVPVTGEENPSRISNQLDYIVVNQNGEQIGEVNDMVLNLDQSQVTYVIVGTGGFLEIGEKDVFVPWDQLELQVAGATTDTMNNNANGNGNANGNTNSNNNGNANGNTNGATTTTTTLDQPAFVLLADQAMFENAPDVDVNAALPDMGQPAGDWDLEIRNYWQGGGAGAGAGAGTGTGTETPAAPGAAQGNGNANGNTNGNANGNANNNAAGTGTGVMTAELQGVVLATDILGSNVTVGATGAVMQNQGTDQTQGQAQGTGTPAAPVAPQGTASPDAGAGTGMGTDQTVSANIEDLIVEIDSGSIQYIVINSSIDGAERWIPVPLGMFNWDPTTSMFILNVDGTMLAGAPFFEDGQFPDTMMDGWDTEFNSYWQGAGTGNNNGSGTGTNATATP